MLKGLTGIHLLAKGPHGHCQENQGLSLLVTAVMGMTCAMGFFHSHWHTEHLPETFSSQPFETLWQSGPEALPWGTTSLCSNAGRNAHTSLYLPQFSQAPPTVCPILQLKLCEIHKHVAWRHSKQCSATPEVSTFVQNCSFLDHPSTCQIFPTALAALLSVILSSLLQSELPPLCCHCHLYSVASSPIMTSRTRFCSSPFQHGL